MVKGEIKEYVKKIGKITCERNEAFAKLDIFRDELRTLQNYIGNVEDLKFFDERIERIKEIVGQKEVNSEDLQWIYRNIADIEGDLLRLTHNERLYKELMLQKSLELQRIQGKKQPTSCKGLGRLKNFEKSSICKSSLKSSPSISIDTSALTPNPSPRKHVSFLFHGDVAKPFHNDSDSKIIDELAAFKLKFAIFQEFIIKRDNDIRGVLKLIKSVLKDNEKAKIDKKIIESFVVLIIVKINSEPIMNN